MPKLKKPRTVNPKHRDIMKDLGAWLAADLKSDEAPLRLAQLHLGEHGTRLYECRSCGVAKAIIDCAVSIAEKAGYEFVETIRKNRLDLAFQRGQLEKSITLFCSLHLERDRTTTATSRIPVEDVLVLQPDEMLFEEEPLPSSQASTVEEVRDRLGGLLGPIQNALRRWDALTIHLSYAEKHLGKHIATPSLAERRKSWPRDYVEKKVDCYLRQHGWAYEEIYDFHHPGKPDKGNRPGRNIQERVSKARTSGRPPLIWGWPGAQNEKEARRILDLVMDVLDKQNPSRN